MKENKLARLGTKKLGLIAAGVAIVAILATASAFAANGSFGPSTLQGVKNVNVAISRDAVNGELMHIVKNKTDLYSFDGGETWNDVLPDGFKLDSKGNLQKIK